MPIDMPPDVPQTGSQRLPARSMRILGRWLFRSLAVVGLVTTLVILTPVVSWWVLACSGPIQQPKGDILILLSAAADDKDGISYSSYWRARYALLAWQTGGFKNIVIAGGGGPGILKFLAAYGIPRDAIIAESQSTSSRENGLAIARLIPDLPGKKVLLTSDYHMFRAIHAFRKLGIDVEPMAVPDLLQTTAHWYGRFPAFETMLVESAKIGYYKLRGWI
jgi:uncharacterized SAM-binding protein YcdF (DUF218 family)